MAPWARILSPNSRSETSVVGTAQTPPTPPRAPSRITEADLLEQRYGIPSLGTSSRNAQGAPGSTKAPRPGGHGRSMSHPFPALFSSKKKRNTDPVTSGFESTDEDSPTPNVLPNPSLRTGGKGSKVPDKDLTTGKCMTCDSTVRWPKELKVFRCTVCLTINDLRPIRLEARRGDGHRAPVATKAGSSSQPEIPRKVVPVSVERTRQLIDKCISAYLLERLKHNEGHPSTPVESPLESPSVAKFHESKEGTSNPWGDPNVPSSIPTPPIHLSGRPIEASEGYFVSQSDSSCRPGIGPYSTSSPGNYFQSAMEHREPSNLTNQSKEPLGSQFHGSRMTNDRDLNDEDKEEIAQHRRATTAKHLFRPLEDYVISCFGIFECINSSFTTFKPSLTSRTASEGSKRAMSTMPDERRDQFDSNLSELDAKTLLLGNFAENGSWWTGNNPDHKKSERSRSTRNGDVINDRPDITNVKSSRIDWADVNEWYHLVLNPSRPWRRKLDTLLVAESSTPMQMPSSQQLDEMEEEITDAEAHAQRVLLKATESLLKRPGRPLIDPDDLRFLLIILANPLLYPSHSGSKTKDRSRSRSASRDRQSPRKPSGLEVPRAVSRPISPGSSSPARGISGQHSGIIKRVLGLLSNVPNECHHHLVSWFSRFANGHFQRTIDLVGSFVTYRLTRQHGRRRELPQDPTAGLIPNTAGPGRTTSAALHAALSVTANNKKVDNKPQSVIYNDDWQIKAAARVMALLFSANNNSQTRRNDTRALPALERGHSAGLAAREKAHSHGQILPTSDFYNTLLDYSDLVSDFEAWESRRGKFTFCQYPFFLSIWAKIQILEHDARRQMEVKAREAFFDSIMTHRNVNQYLILKIRRDCLVEDSLKGVSEVVGTGGEEVKKGLRIEFKGEEGIDAGGLRKEWFLLLVREVFNPDHGMFIYDEDSHFCYFNPNSFETTDQFFLVGVVLGLAIYNSTILDVALPPFAFRKLLAASPAAAPGATSHAKPTMTYSLEDLAEFRPSLATGLKQLLEFEGDVETTFCRDFVADVDRYGQTLQVPLCPNGEAKPVTNSNRREFVELYVRYLLDTAVVRQFEPFKRGFFTVCAGNALSLFRPEEIELLIRGSDEPLDIPSLRAVSICDNWGVPTPKEQEPVINWFWDSFQSAPPKDQRKLLSFITGSDRIPGMGAASLVIKLSCLGEDSPRFPVARTCFNQLSLWRYSSRQRLEGMLWRAVYESEGFGLK